MTQPVLTCTAPDCGLDAALQWQRSAAPTEDDQFQTFLQTPQQSIAAHHRTQATLHLVQLRDRLDAVQRRATADPPDRDAARILPDAYAHVATAEQQLTDIPDPAPVTAGPVAISVFGCATHAVSLDAACWLHQPGCLTTDPGVCNCTPPVPAD